MGLGATSIGVGALYGTGAFSSVNAGRGVSINAANDLNALFKIDDEEDGSPTEPIFTNKTSLFMDVTLEEQDSNLTFKTEDFEGDGSINFNLPTTDDSQAVEIEAEEVGDALVDISVELQESDSGPKRGHISLLREFAAVQSEQADITGEVTFTGGSGRLTFSIENSGNIDIVLAAIGIRDTTNDNITTVDDGELLGTPGPGQGNIDERVVVEDAEEIPVDDQVFVDFRDLNILELDVGQDIELRFDKFNDDPRDETITIELLFEDQSSITFDLSD